MENESKEPRVGPNVTRYNARAIELLLSKTSKAIYSVVLSAALGMGSVAQLAGCSVSGEDQLAQDEDAVAAAIPVATLAAAMGVGFVIVATAAVMNPAAVDDAMAGLLFSSTSADSPASLRLSQSAHAILEGTGAAEYYAPQVLDAALAEDYARTTNAALTHLGSTVQVSAAQVSAVSAQVLPHIAELPQWLRDLFNSRGMDLAGATTTWLGAVNQARAGNPIMTRAVSILAALITQEDVNGEAAKLGEALGGIADSASEHASNAEDLLQAIEEEAAAAIGDRAVALAVQRELFIEPEVGLTVTLTPEVSDVIDGVKQVRSDVHGAQSARERLTKKVEDANASRPAGDEAFEQIFGHSREPVPALALPTIDSDPAATAVGKLVEVTEKLAGVVERTAPIGTSSRAQGALKELGKDLRDLASTLREAAKPFDP